MASCCSSTFNLSSFFTLLTFSLSYFVLPFYCLSPFFSPNFHILLYCLFSLLYNNLFIVFFNLIFWGAFPGDGFTYFIYAIVYFLSVAEHIVSPISPQLSGLFLYKFFTSIFQCQCLVTCHTHSCDFLDFIWIIYVWLNFKYFVILLLINI